MAKTVAIIAGTGFEDAFEAGTLPSVVETPFGDATVIVTNIDGYQIVVLPRHGSKHNIPPHKINVRAQMWALKEMQVAYVLSTAATGSLRIDRCPGDIIVLSDFIDWRGEITTYYNGDDGLVRHTDFSEPFSVVGRDALLQSAKQLESEFKDTPTVFQSGIYMCVNGPRYETPAEVRMFAKLGADVVGMTVAQEAVLARELSMGYAAVAVVTNLGTGLSNEALRHDEVSKQMQTSKSFLIQLFSRAAKKLFETIDS